MKTNCKQVSKALCILLGGLAALFLVACAPDEPAPAAPPAQLSADYRVTDIVALKTADDLDAACAAEVAALQAALATLERPADGGSNPNDGPANDLNYLEYLNSQFVSGSNMANRAGTLAAVHPEAPMRDAGDVCGQALTKVYSELTLSRPIYDRLSAIDLAAADPETRRFVEKLLLTFRLAGVDQDEETRQKIKTLNDEIVAIGQAFDRNIADDVRYLELNSVDQLAGLPDDYIASHPPDENGVIRISTQYPDVFPLLTYAESDEVRREMTSLFNNRAWPANEELLQRLLQKRYELARLLGYASYAELATVDKMVGSPERVQQFLDELTGYTEEAQAREYEMLLARRRQDQPDAERVEPWQSTYLSEKVRQEHFDLDSREVREYFNYAATRDGILSLVQDLFGVEITPWETAAWHEDVEAYELREDGELLGRFYLDMHPREGKFQHAAAFPLQDGITGAQLPLAALVCNFPRGSELMQHNQVVTFLHEFGHLLHFLFAGRHHWANISGISTEWDFVEAPSQMLEEWVWDYDTIAPFARNAAGEPLPRELLDRMIAARDFGLGLATRRQLSFAAMSLGLYHRDPQGLDLKDFTDDMSRQYTPFEPQADTHFYAAFGHLNGYSAIYYTYQWSLAIATDLFTRFQAEGLRNVETAGEYREQILGQGGARPAAELVTGFLGRDISFKPYADRLSGTSAPPSVERED
jgi:thimet oligopeptidase